MTKTHFDLMVIGAGPGGYVAAIKAAQLGMNVACVDKRSTLGGTCLNVGCIPSKALLQSSEKYEEAQHSLKSHGVDVQGVTLNLDAMMQRKAGVVDGLTKGIAGLFKKNKVATLHGTASFQDGKNLKVTKEDGSSETYTADAFLIATGSESAPLKGVDVDEKVIVSSTGALALDKVPETLVVIGGGYIGLELGSVWQRLGAQVHVVEYAPSIVPAMDKDVSKEMQKILGKQGMQFHLSTKVTGVTKKDGSAEVTIETADGGESKTLQASVVLLSIGRRPNTDGLGLENTGVKKDERGFITVDPATFATGEKGVYAIGDVIPGPMLAHKAEEEGVVCVEMLAGQSGHINYDAIPGVVYTWPEVATVGKTEQQLKEAGTEYTVGKFPFMANSRARANDTGEGFVKLLADKKTDKLLGAHIIGPDAGTMIAELALAMEFGASSEDIARTCHAHPTLNEAVKEAALATFDKPIHI